MRQIALAFTGLAVHAPVPARRDKPGDFKDMPIASPQRSAARARPAWCAQQSARARLRASVVCPVLRTLALAGLLLSNGAGAQPAASGALDLTGLLPQSLSDAACSEERIVGQCYCAGIACGLRIERFVPVALVETTRGPGDSLLGPLPPLPLAPNLDGASASSALSTTDNTSEAHVWSLPSGPLPGVSCILCTAGSAARLVPVPQTAPLACGPADRISAATASVAAAIAGPWLPQLSYASELDAVNWRTGCRDLANVTGRVPALACAGPLAAVTKDVAADCLGRWGPLRPRQMRDIGPDPVLYSAKTAVRAMSIARDQIGQFAYPVDTRGKLQQAYPAVSSCFAVGALPLPTVPDAARPTAVSPDGRYGWIYWRPTSCCIGYGAARQCLRLPR
jgi:hypothetical protein